jgi:taurine dioxygenase
VKLPKIGGDTQVVNMYEAYDGLPKRSRSGSTACRRGRSIKETQRAKAPELASGSVVHPIVRTHPETGREAIYINPIRIEEIVGIPAQEALPLLDELLEHAIQEKFQYRHRWKAGDLVIWDNRCLMHKAQRLPA